MAFQQTEIGGETLLDGVMGTIRQRIASRSLTPGAKLPSIRALAQTMRVSKSTVVEAYERLAAEGVIRSRPGSGYFVSAPPGAVVAHGSRTAARPRSRPSLGFASGA